MITSSILLILLGCFAWIHTSKKAVLQSHTIVEQWLQSNIKPAKIIGSALWIIALYLSANYFGNTAGFLFWLISLMVIFSLLIIVIPLKIINYKYMFIACSILLTIEMITNYAS